MGKVDSVTLGHILAIYKGIKNEHSLLKKEAYKILIENGFSALELYNIENNLENN